MIELLGLRLFNSVLSDFSSKVVNCELAGKQHAYRNLDSKSLPHARQNLHSQERVASEIKEVVIDTDLVDPEQFGVDCSERLFNRHSGRHKRDRRSRLHLSLC